ncbi:hypothetical protein AB0J86_26875 [Micromonospora sp. NPDC049559]|uniref:hypothetical protein n=1 Tax=Micromonospora sp. NPDC049559 TaxID=3155923 RepID=UPI00343574BE
MSARYADLPAPFPPAIPAPQTRTASNGRQPANGAGRDERHVAEPPLTAVRAPASGPPYPQDAEPDEPVRDRLAVPAQRPAPASEPPAERPAVQAPQAESSENAEAARHAFDESAPAAPGQPTELSRWRERLRSAPASAPPASATPPAIPAQPAADARPGGPAQPPGEVPGRQEFEAGANVPPGFQPAGHERPGAEPAPGPGESPEPPPGFRPAEREPAPARGGPERPERSEQPDRAPVSAAPAEVEPAPRATGEWAASWAPSWSAAAAEGGGRRSRADWAPRWGDAPQGLPEPPSAPPAYGATAEPPGYPRQPEYAPDPHQQPEEPAYAPASGGPAYPPASGGPAYPQQPEYPRQPELAAYPAQPEGIAYPPPAGGPGGHPYQGEAPGYPPVSGGPAYPAPREPGYPGAPAYPGPQPPQPPQRPAGEPVPPPAARPVEHAPEALPQRVPAEPDVPTAPEPPAESAAETPELARTATHLRREEAPTPVQDRPEGFDVEAILAAVRGVAGVRDASLRKTPAGAHSLRLDLSDGADPAEVSRHVARLLQERMGLAAAPQNLPGAEEQSPPPGPRAGAERRSADAQAPTAPAQDASRRRRGAASHRGQSVTEERTETRAAPPGSPTPAGPVGPFAGHPVKANTSYSGSQVTTTESAPSRPLNPGGPPGPRVVLDHVQVSTFGLEATVEVRLIAGELEAAGLATGPAVDGYVLRLCAVSAATAIDKLLRTSSRLTDRGRCFVEHAAVVPFGSCEVATVVVLLVCDGWVEQLAGSALVAGDPRQAVVRATLAAVNRRLEALLA